MSRARGDIICPETMPWAMRKRILHGEATHEDIKWMLLQYDNLVLSCATTRRWIQNVYDATKPNIAWQHFQIKATDLSASDDPDSASVPRSVLATNGTIQSDYQFNWMQSGGVRKYTVNLGPGDGSPSHAVIIDRDDANIKMAKFKAVEDASILVSGNVARPYGMTGLKLQFGEWRPSGGEFKFWPSSLSVGTWVYLEQELPMVTIR